MSAADAFPVNGVCVIEPVVELPAEPLLPPHAVTDAQIAATAAINAALPPKSTLVIPELPRVTPEHLTQDFSVWRKHGPQELHGRSCVIAQSRNRVRTAIPATPLS